MSTGAQVLTVGEPICTVLSEGVGKVIVTFKLGIECDTVAVRDQRVLLRTRMLEIRVGLFLSVRRCVS